MLSTWPWLSDNDIGLDFIYTRYLHEKIFALVHESFLMIIYSCILTSKQGTPFCCAPGVPRVSEQIVDCDE